jgi:hypothetical protein
MRGPEDAHQQEHQEADQQRLRVFVAHILAEVPGTDPEECLYDSPVDEYIVDIGYT